MSELEDKLNAVLSDPEEMSRLAQMASKLMGSMGPAPDAADNGRDVADPLSAALGRVLRGMDNRNGSSLLAGVSPYLDAERRSRLERALHLASAARAAGFAFREMGGV